MLKPFFKNLTTKYKRVILCGPAASGKDYARKILETYQYTYGVSYTTRPLRKNEIDGKDYNFITNEKFIQLIDNNLMYEYIKYNVSSGDTWYYGTTNEQFYNYNLFIMTPEGINLLKSEDRAESYVIYFNIPIDIRKERLLKRKMPGDSTERRLVADTKDFKDFKDYNLEITNKTFKLTI